MNNLQQHDGKWKVSERLALWNSEAPLLTEEVSEEFFNIAIDVLSEADPILKLPKEKRFSASLFGHERKYSDNLRKGIAESIALFGAKQEKLATCGIGFGQDLADRITTTLLSNSSASEWSSLNDLLPLLAEASPDVFLESIEGHLKDGDATFKRVFSEEEGSILGRIYSTGLLWGLEALAWNPKYLNRVCLILAGLSAVDPGGRFTNRPINSLTAILLPWMPYTYADIETRHNAMSLIIARFPNIAWDALLSLLPRIDSTTSPTAKPVFRHFDKPEGWTEGATNGERWADEGHYADRALELAGNNPKRLQGLLQFYFLINPRFSDFRNEYRERLKSLSDLSISEEDRGRLWNAISRKTGNHRKYRDSRAWLVPENELEELEAIADEIKPKSPEIRNRRLFSGHEGHLYDGTGDFREQQNRLRQRRCEAVEEILESVGFNGLRDFWRAVDSSYEVGDAYAIRSKSEQDRMVLPHFLESDIPEDRSFAKGYLMRRFATGEWTWVGELDRRNWTSEAKGEFFATLPFIREVWDRVEEDLGSEEREYWSRTWARPDRDRLDDIHQAIRKLIDFERADAALECLWLSDRFTSDSRDQIFDALEALDFEKNRVDTHTIGEAFNHLQKDPNVDQDRLVKAEFKFLDLLNGFGNPHPLGIHRWVAECPEEFCRILSLFCRSKHEEENTAVDGTDEEKQIVAGRAYHILSDWKVPPGYSGTDSFNANRMWDWFRNVKKWCLENGRWEVAASHIGGVMYFAPKSKLEPNLPIDPVCELLETQESEGDEHLRIGFRIRIFNERGAHFCNGGKAENELADKWENTADTALEKGFDRLARTLRGLAKTYRKDAEHWASERLHEFD